MAEEFDHPDEVTPTDVLQGVEHVALRDILTVNDDFLTRMGQQLIGETSFDRIGRDPAKVAIPAQDNNIQNSGSGSFKTIDGMSVHSSRFGQQ
jgi:hypothetical protein